MSGKRQYRHRRTCRVAARPSRTSRSAALAAALISIKERTVARTPTARICDLGFAIGAAAASVFGGRPEHSTQRHLSSACAIETFADALRREVCERLRCEPWRPWGWGETTRTAQRARTGADWHTHRHTDGASGVAATTVRAVATAAPAAEREMAVMAVQTGAAVTGAVMALGEGVGLIPRASNRVRLSYKSHSPPTP